MNGARRFILAALAAFVWLPAAVGAQRSDLEKIIRRRLLANGLEVIVVENHGVPLATVEVDVRNGAFTQSPEYAGLAHMYEHMFFRASRDYPQSEGFVNRASELGGIFNGSTEEERVNYYMTVPADSVRGALQTMASSLRYPLFREDELERERQVVLGEYDRNESNPGFEFQKEMTRRLYPGQYSRKNTIGDRDVIRTVTPEKMRYIQRKYYVPNNSALVVAGDVVPDSVFKYAELYYGDWARGADPFATDPIPPVVPLAKNDVVVSQSSISAVVVMLQWQGPSVRRDPASTYAADVFSDALNSPSSGFQQRLVDGGLFQGVTVNYVTLDQAGPITISAQTTPDKLKEGLAALEAEIEKFDDPGYFTPAELADVKAQRATETAFGIERASGFTHTIGFWWSVADLEYFMGYVDNMAKQTPADLRRYAARYIVAKPHVSGVLMSPADRQALSLTERDLMNVAAPKVQP